MVITVINYEIHVVEVRESSTNDAHTFGIDDNITNIIEQPTPAAASVTPKEPEKPATPPREEIFKPEPSPMASAASALAGAHEEEEKIEPRRKGTDESVVGGGIGGDDHIPAVTSNAEVLSKMQ